MINQEKLTEEIVIAKKSMAKLVREKNKSFIGNIEKYNDGIILAAADFKCQRCGSEKELQIHHLIMRPAKDFMDFWRYASQRYYWANAIILCSACHRLYHKIMGQDIGEEKLVMSEENINKWKAIFGYTKNIEEKQ